MKILESVARTINGNSGDTIARGSGESLRCQLNVVGVSGTSPALNVVIEDSLDSGATWNTIGTFAQKTTSTREVINITQPFSENLRVSWTIAGTSAVFTFSVDWHISTRRGS
jgi:hypothetical protein